MILIILDISFDESRCGFDYNRGILSVLLLTSNPIGFLDQLWKASWRRPARLGPGSCWYIGRIDRRRQTLSRRNWRKLLRSTQRSAGRVSGLDDSVTRAKLLEAMAGKGCTANKVTVGEIRPGPGGARFVVVRCQVGPAKKVVLEGTLKVGWSLARVRVLDARPMHCYRCMRKGHTAQRCPSGMARSQLCYRCGIAGHKAAECRAVPHCAVCEGTGRSSGHVMRSRRCDSPATSGKSSGGEVAESPAPPGGGMSE
ncbi:unnamed protein product [Chilo suppressalis]|uniref:CCHC-type domain-containing protein n=1 Tax=Chilo suppressalis TaxID=168631 RepID=A0ABN8BGU1_CHISP|nr:unnamed protein product [Chilo suppressalis]